MAAFASAAFLTGGCASGALDPVEGCGEGAGGGGPLSVSRTTAPAELRLGQGMAIFDEPKTASDELPTTECSLERFLRGPISNIPRSAEVLTSKSRLVMDHLGAVGRRLFAVPVSTGEICTFLVPDASQYCGEPFQLIIWDPDGYESGEPTLLYGLVPNDVVKVHVRDAGRWRPAQVGPNGFYYDSNTWAFDERQPVRLRYRNGETETT